jgi:hypothetical protein
MKDPDRGRHLVVEIGVPVVVLRPELDPGDVAHARHPPFGVGRNHDVAELIGAGEPPERLHRELKPARRGGGRLVDGAGGDLDVGGTQGVHDIGPRQAARLHLGWVEPYPHGIVARAEHDGVADAVDTGEDVLDVDRRVVGDVLLVERPVGRDQMDHHHQVG